MKFEPKQLALYAVTSESVASDDELLDKLETALRGGVTFVQLRDKSLSDADFLRRALAVQVLCQRYQVPFVINDRVNLALICAVDGVHVGQSDMSIDAARQLLGPDKIIGASAKTVAAAQLAERQGANYLGVGAVFATATKRDADQLSIAELKKICQAVSIPVVAIGGIHKGNILRLQGSGIVGVAVVSAIFSSENITESTERLRALSAQLQ